MEIQRTKYSEIVLLHCIGVVMIFICHVLMRLKIMAIAEGLLAGVPLFLFVSGFLCGIKKKQPIDMHWLINKSKRILTPYYIILTFVLVLYLIIKTEPFILKQWIVLFANIQGFTNFVFSNDLICYYSPLVQGLGHFWYVTVIMVCYLLAIPINCIYENSSFVQNHWKSIFFVSFFVLQPLLIYYNVQLNSINVFFLGFFISKSQFSIARRTFAISTIIMLFFVGMRLVCNYYFDNTLFYDQYIASLAPDAIGIWIAVLVFYLRTISSKLIDEIAKLKIIIFLDSIIYEVYLVHHILIKGSWSIFNFVENTPLAIMIVVAITLVLSVILHFISRIIIFYMNTLISQTNRLRYSR